MKELLPCIAKKTFSLPETVMEKESVQVNIVKQDTEIWSEDITTSYAGKNFKSKIQLVKRYMHYLYLYAR